MSEPVEGTIPLGAILDALETVDAQNRAQATERAQAYATSPAYVIDAEEAVCGACLVDPVRVLADVEGVGLAVGHFYGKQTREIWGAIVAVNAKGRDVTAITVADELNRRAKLDDVGGPVALSKLEARHSMGVALASSSARVVVERAALRAIQGATAHALERCKLGDSPSAIVDEVMTDLSGIAAQRTPDNMADLSIAARAVLDALPAFGGTPKGISTGFYDVDFYFKPAPGDLIIVAARPSMGKTQWALDFLRDVSVRRGDAALFFSLEMSAEQIVHRLIAADSTVELRKKRFLSTEATEVTRAAADVASAPLIVDETPAISIGEIKARARYHARRAPLSVVAVDYMQLVTPSTTRTNDNRATEIGEVSAGLKALGRELRCPVVALSQLNRSVEARSDRRPVMSDLRESGSIEQDADVVAFLYREEYYAKDRTPVDKRGVAEFIVAKNRNGPTGTATLHFNQKLPRFDSLARTGGP